MKLIHIHTVVLALMAFMAAPAFAQDECNLRWFEDFSNELHSDLIDCPMGITLESVFWNNLQGDDIDWIGKIPGSAFSGAFVSAFGVNGTNIRLEGQGCCNATGVLESDTLDLTGFEVASLSFRRLKPGSTSFLSCSVSSNGGGSWSSIWNESSSSSFVWETVELDLSSFVGHEEVLIRFNGITGSGSLPDLALDNIEIVASPPPLTFVDEGTMTHSDLKDQCLIELGYTKTEADCAVELQHAELLVDLNLGDQYRFGGTEVDSVIVDFVIHGLSSSTPATPVTTDTIQLHISDDRHPEQLYVHEFTEEYDDIDLFEMIILDYDSGEHQYPHLVDDIAFEFEVDLRYGIGAYDLSDPSAIIVTPTSATLSSSTELNRMQFEWGSQCPVPQYRFQLLRLYDTASPDDGCTSTTVEEQDWNQSALTLEVSETELDLTILEGTGHYLWRVQPIGSLHDGGEANGMNWGNPSTPISGTAVNLCGETLSPADQFWYADPMEGQNRSYTRAFSRNVMEDGSFEFLQTEGVTYHTEGLFPQQSLTRHDGIESVLAKPRNRDYYEREPLNFMAYPADTTDLNLTYVPGVITNEYSKMYSAGDFDTGSGPAAASGKLSTYFSEGNADQSIPSANGYPFSGIQYTQDGSNRTTASGREGAVLRLGGEHQQRFYYGSVEQQELTRLFGHEAPDASTVEKIISVSPDNITTQAYVDQFGRTIATNYIKNSAMDTSKYTPIGDGLFYVTGSVPSVVDPDSTTWSAVTRKPFPTPPVANIALDYTLTPNRFTAYCEEYCGTCDYSVRITIVDYTNPMNPLYDTTMVMAGQEWVDCAADISSFEAISVEFEDYFESPATYVISKVLQRNIPDGGSSYLSHHLDNIRTAVEEDVHAVTDTLLAMLADIDAEGLTTVDDFYSYCINHGEAIENEDGDTTHFQFSTSVCDSLSVAYYSCGYDCDPDERDFEAFFNEIALNTYIDMRESGTYRFPYEDDDGKTNLAFVASNWNISPSSGGGYYMAKNLAVTSFGVAVGEFNLIMENMIQDAEDHPETYGNYTCENIYAALDQIASSYIYQLDQSRVMRDLIDILGAVYQDYSINSCSLLPAGSTYSESDMCWLTHPHRYVRGVYPSSCLDLLELRGYNDLSWSNADDRETITGLLLDLDRCLYDPSYEETAEEIGTSGDVNNMYYTIRNYCLDATQELETIFQDQIAEALSEVSFPSPADYVETESCMLENLKGHARSLCPDDAPLPTRIHPYPFIPASSAAFPQLIWDCATGTCHNLQAGTFYEVAATGIETGHYITYGGRDYGPNTAMGAYFMATDDPGLVLRRSSPGVEIWEVTAPFNSLDSLDIDGLQDILAGYPIICLENCDSAFIGLNSPAVVEGSVLLDTDWEDYVFSSGGSGQEWTLASNGWLSAHPPSPTSSTDPFNDHTEPAFVKGKFSNINHTARLVTGYNPNPTYMSTPFDPRMEGNGMYTEQRLIFSNLPGRSYRLEFDFNIADSVALDNLYFVLTNPGPATSTFYTAGWEHPANGQWLYGDEGPVSHYSGSAEVLYPVTEGIIITHKQGQILNGSSSFTRIEEDFTSPCYGAASPCSYNLYVFGRQDETSDSTRYLLDNIRIVQLDSIPQCDSLYVRYEHFTPSLDTLELPTCEQRLARDLVEAINNQSATIVDDHLADAERAYFRNCVPQEEFNVGFPLDQYQYTLTSYDASRSIAKTISPMGVNANDNYTLEDDPEHSFERLYAHDALKNPVKSYEPNQTDTAHSYYDRVGRLRFMQYPSDIEAGTIRYTCYDALGRIIRIGSIEMDLDDALEHLQNPAWPSASCSACYNTITSVYSVPNPHFDENQQQNLINRVSYAFTSEGDTTSYSYNAHGQIVDEYFTSPRMAPIHLHRTMDVASTSVLALEYNTGKSDQFYERFFYNADGSVKRHQSSLDGRIHHNQQDLAYNHLGQLEGVTSGHYQVHAQDLVYNLHGQLYGTNITQEARNNPNSIISFARHHYAGEHQMSDLLSSALSPVNETSYFDGHLSNETSAFHPAFQTSLPEDFGTAYKYDERLRLFSSHRHTLNDSQWSEAIGPSSSYGYDANSNLTSILRLDADGNTLDDIELHRLENADRLTHVTNAASHEEAAPNQNDDNYAFNADGDLISDVANSIEHIEYFVPGKPTNVTFVGDSSLQFMYDPSGKLRAQIRMPAEDTTMYFYSGDVRIARYDNDPEAPGMVKTVHDGGSFRHITDNTAQRPDSSLAAQSVFTRVAGDHPVTVKGRSDNVNLVVSDLPIGADTTSDGVIDIALPSITSYHNYYPYGKTITSSYFDNSFDSHPLLSESTSETGYQSKPKIQSLSKHHDTYHFGGRMLDATLGQWFSVDPLFSASSSESPYCSMASNPIAYKDPSGLIPLSHDPRDSWMYPPPVYNCLPVEKVNKVGFRGQWQYELSGGDGLVGGGIISVEGRVADDPVQVWSEGLDLNGTVTARIELFIGAGLVANAGVHSGNFAFVASHTGCKREVSESDLPPGVKFVIDRLPVSATVDFGVRGKGNAILQLGGRVVFAGTYTRTNDENGEAHYYIEPKTGGVAILGATTPKGGGAAAAGNARFAVTGKKEDIIPGLRLLADSMFEPGDPMHKASHELIDELEREFNNTPQDDVDE